MPLNTLPRRCWTFACEYEDSRSMRWREHALDAAQLSFMHADGCCRPYQLDSYCIEAACDCCGIPYLGRHFATMAEATARLARLGWITDHQCGWRCPLCPIPYRITAAATHRLDQKGAISNAWAR